MTPTDLVSSTAICISVLAALACIVTVPVVFRKGASIQSELYDQMGQFKAITDGTWSNIMTLRTDVLGGHSRKTRQDNFGHCHCYDRKWKRLAIAIAAEITDFELL